jgi:putative aldouronate transport system substrate-binding protein
MTKKILSLVMVCLMLTISMAWGGGARSTTTTPGGRLPITWVPYQLSPLVANPEILEFFNQKFNVDIQIWNTEAANQATQVNLWLAANQIPDVFRGTLLSMDTYYNQGVLAEISESVFRNTAPSIYNEFNSIVPGFTTYFKLNGKMYALPSQVNRAVARPIVYRGDWIRNVGKTSVPQTLAELEELMYLFANNDPDQNGRKDTYGLSTTGVNVVYGAYGYQRGQWSDLNGSLVYSSIQPEMK